MQTSNDESAPEHRVGKLLASKWRIERLLGVGSVASAFAAVDVTGGARVAIKVMHPELLEDTSLRERFLREVRLAGSIEHAAIVRVLGDGTTEDGAPFLVMEYLDGETLDARMRRKGGKLPIREALWVADATLDALAQVHDMGIVHRGLCVENLFLTSDHVVKVLDFGVARVRRAAERKAAASLARPPTGEDGGSPAAEGVEDDLWAVGAAVFTMVTGEPVLEGQLLEDLRHAKEEVVPPTLATANLGLPSAVVELVDRALSLSRTAGWTDARAMRRSVHEAIEVVKNRASHNPHATSPFSAPMRAVPRRAISADAPALPDRGNAPTLGADAHLWIPRAASIPGDVRAAARAASGETTPGTISLKWAVVVIGAAVCIGGALALIFGR